MPLPQGIKSKPGAVPVLTRIGNENATYQLGAELGRGGFGAVFQALNVDTGDFVAVKRIELTDVDSDNLSSLEIEIDLLKKLNHANIVKYVDSIRTEYHLHIILEFMENGSLAGVCKKFGNFSESLAAIYMTQVLQGLQYLHEQGVLHRDIKGANILTTKDGQVKLADFGVAIKLSDSRQAEVDVVGSPYWMAPEIIEMNAPTSACDIWSLGCTVVELLTGRPPYFELAAMAALFRIVQDDYPALPEGISEALRDFLLQCFKKEPMLRKGAPELLKHPWLKNPRSHLEKVREQAARMSIQPLRPPGPEDDLIDIEEGNEEDLTLTADSPPTVPREESVVNTIRMYAKDAAGRARGDRYAAIQRLERMPEESLVQRPEDWSEDWDKEAAVQGPVLEKEATHKLGGWRHLLKDLQAADPRTSPAPEVFEPVLPGELLLTKGDSQTDEGAGSKGEEEAEDWDAELNEGQEVEHVKQQPALTKPLATRAGVNLPPALSIGVTRMEGKATSPKVGSPLGRWKGFDDVVIGEDDDEAGQRPISKARRRSTAYRDNGGQAERLSTRGTKADSELLTMPSATLFIPAEGGNPIALDQFAETEGDTGFEDLDVLPVHGRAREGREGGRAGERGGLVLRMRPPDASPAQEDVAFLDDLDFENQPDRGVHVRRVAEVHKLMESIRPDSKDKVVRETCAQLLDLFDAHPDLPSMLVAQHGVMPILGMLEVRGLRKMTSILAVIHRFIKGDARVQEHLAFLGFIPTIIRFASSDCKDRSSDSVSPYSASAFFNHAFFGASNRKESGAAAEGPAFRQAGSLRLEAAKCIYEICMTSQVCLQMFIGCGGLNIVVDLLSNLEDSPRSPESRLFALIGIDCVVQISTHLDVRRNDFCRLLTKVGLLPNLALVFVQLLNSMPWARPPNDPSISEAPHTPVPSLLRRRSSGNSLLAAFANVTSSNNTTSNSNFSNLFQASTQPTNTLNPPISTPSTASTSCSSCNSTGAGHVAETGINLETFRSSESWAYIEKTAHIIFFLSRADPYVKGCLAQDIVVQAILRILCPPTPALFDFIPYAELTVLLLKCMKNISFQENTLEKLDQMHAIKTVVPLMDRRGHLLDKEMENQILPFMYNLCRVNSKRQEKAAAAGIIPLLQRFYYERSHMKEIALSILCDLAHTSDPTREELWRNNGVDFYLLLLPENYWQVPALNALSIWLSIDVRRIESVLVRPTSVESLVSAIHSCQGKTFEQISGPLLDMMSKSANLRKTLGNSSSFILALSNKLQNPRAIVRKPVLMLLKIIYSYHEKKAMFIQKYDLHAALSQLVKDNDQVLVKDLAMQLLQDFDKQTKATGR